MIIHRTLIFLAKKSYILVYEKSVYDTVTSSNLFICDSISFYLLPNLFCSFGLVQFFKNLLYFYTVSILNKINPTLSFNIINPVLNVHKIKLIFKNRWVRSMLVFAR